MCVYVYIYIHIRFYCERCFSIWGGGGGGVPLICRAFITVTPPKSRLSHLNETCLHTFSICCVLCFIFYPKFCQLFENQHMERIFWARVVLRSESVCWGRIVTTQPFRGDAEWGQVRAGQNVLQLPGALPLLCHSSSEAFLTRDG